ncbi:MAG: zinc-ribbon domain-containing protein [Eubacterium sp.]|nr:zinc-ribbon domain-containing protein [Eubacterium sp.]MCI8919435.1 zinc-ribbon domain-containing protein [Eubacterium sp.]
MKCPKCGTDLPDSSQLCTKCGSEVSQNFNYSNMENELLNTVLEEEAINGMSEKSMLYQQQEPDDDDYEEEFYGKESKKQPGRLAAALLTSAAVFAGAVFFLRTFPTEITYKKIESEYQNCLKLMSQKDYEEAAKYVERLLDEDAENLEYLALKNTICEKTGSSKSQMKVLKKIIAADADNYAAYEQLLQLYLAKDNLNEIKKMSEDAPNAAIAAMLKAYLVDAPYLELTPGVYDTIQELVITSEGGHEIYYTLDGSSPKENGTLYTGPILLEQDHFYTVKAVCKNSRGSYGDESFGEYQIGINAVRPTPAEIEQPAVYPDAGEYSTPQMINIDVPIGYQAYYSWSLGTELTPQNGTLFVGGISMPEGDSTLSVIVTDGNGNSSPVKQVAYSYQP